METNSHFADVVVVGAGIGGLCAAKTYKELAPDTNLVILESRKTLGGVWAEQNLYEGLKTNNVLGLYEYSDFPMDAKYGVKEGEHIPGRVMYKYLTDFAVHFDIFRLIQLNTRVIEVERLDCGWKLTTAKTEEDGSTTDELYHCENIIMCNGLVSTPRPVKIPGQDDFHKPIFNQGGLKEQAPPLAKDPEVKTVTVIGASKIGYDAVYLFASHGKQVEWIVRESGGGGVWMSPPWVPLGPWTVLLEHVATMRIFTWFSPCIWGNFDGFGLIRRLLHETWLGRILVANFWEKMRMDTVAGNGYRNEKALEHLEPRESLFWNARVGIHNYPTDVHDFIRSGQVTVRRKDISHLSTSGTINFTDGSHIRTDALVAITGWRLVPTIEYTPDGIDADIGVPSSTYTPSQKAFWDSLDAKADAEILHQFPYLRNPPKAKLPFTQSVTPFRLYRGIAPPGLTARSDNSLAFMKMVHCTANLILAETQALWVFAYLNNKIDIDTEDVYWQTALTSRFGKHRYPWGFSAWWPEFIYDAVPYADMLLTDLGLRKRRKGSWLRELFEGYTVHDYKGINEEWKELQMGKKLESD